MITIKKAIVPRVISCFVNRWFVVHHQKFWYFLFLSSEIPVCERSIDLNALSIITINLHNINYKKIMKILFIEYIMSHGTEQMFCPCLYHKVCGIIYPLCFNGVSLSFYATFKLNWTESSIELFWSSVVHRQSVRFFHIFNFFSRTTGLSSPGLGKIILACVRGLKFVPIKGHALSQGEITAKIY